MGNSSLETFYHWSPSVGETDLVQSGRLTFSGQIRSIYGIPSVGIDKPFISDQKRDSHVGETDLVRSERLTLSDQSTRKVCMGMLSINDDTEPWFYSATRVSPTSPYVCVAKKHISRERIYRCWAKSLSICHVGDVIPHVGCCLETQLEARGISSVVELLPQSWLLLWQGGTTSVVRGLLVTVSTCVVASRHRWKYLVCYD